MYEMSRNNLKAKIYFPDGKAKTLAKLLPESWQEYWQGRE